MSKFKIFVILLLISVVFGLLVISVLVGRKPDPNVIVKQPIRNENSTISFVPIGDSYTIGLGVSQSDRWPNLLASNLRQQGLSVELVTNPAVSGFTVEDAFQEELPALEKLKPDLVTVLIGANDNFMQRDASLFRKDYAKLLDKIQKILPPPHHLILITLPDHTRTPSGKTYSNSAQTALLESYNAVIKEEAAKRQLPLVDLFPLSQKLTDAKYFISDGLHPSAAGYVEWEKLIRPVVIEVLYKN